MSHNFTPSAESVICTCGEPRHHHLPTHGCRCGARIAIDPAVSEWSCPTCGQRFSQGRPE